MNHQHCRIEEAGLAGFIWTSPNHCVHEGITYGRADYAFSIHDAQCKIETYWATYDWDNDLGGYRDDEDLAKIDPGYEEDIPECGLCMGTGIGQHGDPNTSRCNHCGGSGSPRRGRYDEDDWNSRGER